jgi:hypothetical protein
MSTLLPKQRLGTVQRQRSGFLFALIKKIKKYFNAKSSIFFQRATKARGGQNPVSSSDRVKREIYAVGKLNQLGARSSKGEREGHKATLDLGFKKRKRFDG